MIKLIVSINILFFSILTYFIPENFGLKSEESMTICEGMPLEISGENNESTAPTANISTIPSVFATDDTKAYSMPLLTLSAKNQVLMSWTEKDDSGLTSLCLSVSNDKGKTFSDKKIVASGYGIGNNRLMKAKILTKKDGSLVAVFMNNPAATAPVPGQRGSRGGEVSFAVSKDMGNTWSSPKAVDIDPDKGMRGFFGAVLLANDEVAVAYLKDVKNSTKHEERDLRISISRNGVFQTEKLLDAVVCDCCNISLLVDANGALNVYYRDNNDDIRDFARMTSTDNGQTFSKPSIVYNDGWKIQGCPHAGAYSAINGKSAIVSWYSGADKNQGIRLVTQEGKKLAILTDASAKNQTVAGGNKFSLMIWEQNQANIDKSQLFYAKVSGEKLGETIGIEGTINATNGTALIVDNQLIIAHEVKQDSKKNTLKVAVSQL
jgi:BNR repeat-like domain